MTAQLSFDESFEACGVCERIAADGYAAHPHCLTCHRSWTDPDEAHCMSCHRHFLSVESYDGHQDRKWGAHT